MNLAVDFGNTRIKAGLFDGRELLETRIYNSPELFAADREFLSKATRCIIGSVVSTHEGIRELLGEKQVEFFMAKTPIPLKNQYKSILTLGSDRLAASVGAYSLYPDKNVLVIDSGTALKFNFTNAQNEYIGGAISPGLQMRFRALNEFTDKLPLVKFDEDFNKLIGQSTEESILSGVINGILNETDGVISEYKKTYPDLTIVVTGGDTAFFANRLKNRIFAHPHLVLNGLNEILIYNS